MIDEVVRIADEDCKHRYSLHGSSVYLDQLEFPIALNIMAVHMRRRVRLGTAAV